MDLQNGSFVLNFDNFPIKKKRMLLKSFIRKKAAVKKNNWIMFIKFRISGQKYRKG